MVSSMVRGWSRERQASGYSSLVGILGATVFGFVFLKDVYEIKFNVKQQNLIFFPVVFL